MSFHIKLNDTVFFFLCFWMKNNVVLIVGVYEMKRHRFIWNANKTPNPCDCGPWLSSQSHLPIPLPSPEPRSPIPVSHSPAAPNHRPWCHSTHYRDFAKAPESKLGSTDFNPIARHPSRHMPVAQFHCSSLHRRWLSTKFIILLST